MDPDFENKVKRSFSKFREHMDKLTKEIKQNKALLEQLLSRVGESTPEEKMASTPIESRLKGNDQKSSIGNKGVYASKQASMQASKQHLNKHSSIQTTDFDEITLTLLLLTQIVARPKLNPPCVKCSQLSLIGNL